MAKVVAVRDWLDDEEWWEMPAQEPPRDDTEEEDLDAGQW